MIPYVLRDVRTLDCLDDGFMCCVHAGFANPRAKQARRSMRCVGEVFWCALEQDYDRKHCSRVDDKRTSAISSESDFQQDIGSVA